MACRSAPACRRALDEATELWPGRSRASDGICASQTHSRQNPSSDHEPNAQGYATAFDLTDDKANGCDADFLAEVVRLRQDPRIKYVIAERRMFSSYATSSYPAWTWRPYTGDNPHSSHVHFSIVPAAIHNSDPWWPKTIPQEDDDMPTPTTIVDALVAPDGKGVWLLQYDGGIVTKGGAPFLGSYPGLPAEHRRGERYFVAIESFQGGYALVATDGAIYRFPAKRAV